MEELAPGGANSVGALYRTCWKGALPYWLVFDMKVVRVEPLSLIEVEAQGELTGKGLWTFSNQGKTTCVRYDWNVCTTKPWMNLLAPAARPIFRWNHDVIMRWGLEGLTRRVWSGRVCSS